MTNMTNMVGCTSIGMLRYLGEMFKIFLRKYIFTPERVNRWEFACNVDSKSQPKSPLLQRMFCNTNPYVLICMCVCTTSTSQKISSRYFTKVKCVELLPNIYYTSNPNPSKTRDPRIFNLELLSLEAYSSQM